MAITNASEEEATRTSYAGKSQRISTIVTAGLECPSHFLSKIYVARNRTDFF